MLHPIQSEHELICPGCGAVVQNIEESHHQSQNNHQLSINLTLLGSALSKNANYRITSKPSQFYEERVLRKLIDLTKYYDLPERFAQETFNELKRKNRGFRSEKEPIKQLIRILSKDENYIHFKKLNKLKADYEEQFN